MDDQQNREWVAVARLMRPQGRRGELLADRLTDVPGILAAEASLRLTKTGAPAPRADDAAVLVETLWEPTGRNAGRVVLKLRGVDDISAAERLAGKQLMVEANALPALDTDTFYVRDLLGCTLWNNAAPVGEIVDVQFATTPDGRQRLEDAAPLLEVRPVGASSEETVLVPFVRAYLERVNVEARRVEMRLPDGLVDVAAVADQSGAADSDVLG